MFYKKDKKYSISRENGFTLIELLVVIAIIGLLSSVVLASLSSARTKARDSKRVQDIKQLQLALEMYRNTNNAYPVSNWLRSYDANWKNNTNSLALALKPYIKDLPEDPKNENVAPTSNGLSYAYYANGYGGAGQWYMIVFKLENKNMLLEGQDGVRAINGQIFNYGGEDGYILTVGVPRR